MEGFSLFFNSFDYEIEFVHYFADTTLCLVISNGLYRRMAIESDFSILIRMFQHGNQSTFPTIIFFHEANEVYVINTSKAQLQKFKP